MTDRRTPEAPRWIVVIPTTGTREDACPTPGGVPLSGESPPPPGVLAAAYTTAARRCKRGAVAGSVLGGILGAVLAATGVAVLPGIGPFVDAGIVPTFLFLGASGWLLGGVVAIGGLDMAGLSQPGTVAQQGAAAGAPHEMPADTVC